MAIDAHFEETPGAARAPRRRLLLETTGAAGSTGALVRVLNISETGALLQTDTILAPGETIDVDLPEAGSVGAHVVWSVDDLFGCAFAQSLPPHVLSAVRLRARAESVGLPAGSQTEGGFAERLYRLRKARGLTQAQLAAALGVSKPTVWAWEQGRAKPVAERLEGLAAALGVTTADLRPRRSISGIGSGVGEAVAKAREDIALALGISPERVRVMIDL
ncbi:helix-turn-helix domain-containing protein [Novosphingobium sp. 9]|uniref:helix-turn-helix domain-containing protein n=1 Tax=Novosphingobium sp. 9 TaxID=2025349 RepID=UPI0021B644E5|nr:helix-turn-helix domain-containing protein [Novosphingobium sp. 9]